MLGATAYAIMGAESSSRAMNLTGDTLNIDAQALLARLMAFLLGGLRAPLSTGAPPGVPT